MVLVNLPLTNIKPGYSSGSADGVSLIESDLKMYTEKVFILKIHKLFKLVPNQSDIEANYYFDR
jgi:hypothetical protein